MMQKQKSKTEVNVKMHICSIIVSYGLKDIAWTSCETTSSYKWKKKKLHDSMSWLRDV